MINDVYGQALSDFYHDQLKSPLLLHNSYGEVEQMPVEVFYRSEEELSDLERYALSMAKGSVLDVGAGTGVHTLICQELGLVTTAVEVSSMACDIMRQRGVETIINENILAYQPDHKFDTILLLMNGTGVAGKINDLLVLLTHLKNILSPEGKIIIDSSDISYLYDQLPKSHYFGEVTFQYEYDGQKSEVFPWLYVDQDKLIDVASRAGLEAQVIFEGSEDEYLAVLRSVS